MYDVLIIGGGAAGLISAISASYQGDLNICIVDRMDKVGRKLLATGNGRCNLTNKNMETSFFHGENRELIKNVFDQFSHTEAVEFFNKIGLICTEEEGRFYPYSGQASAVLDTLRNEIRNMGIEEVCDFDASAIKCKKSWFEVYSADKKKIEAKRVIVACGGQAMRSLGSNGSGYKLLQSMGHGIRNIYPALVPLRSDNGILKSVSGIRINAIATVIIDGEESSQQCGEVLLTEYGLSGIPIMQLSHFYGGLRKHSEMAISLDLMPEYSAAALFELFKQRRDSQRFHTLEHFLVGLINKKLGHSVMKSAGLSPLSIEAREISDNRLEALAKQIKKLNFNIIGDMSWNNAQVTAGGVNSTEFDETTLESKLVKGLYAAGEVLDVFGDCGGYNLQWAWSTGFIAGKAAGRSSFKIAH